MALKEFDKTEMVERLGLIVLLDILLNVIPRVKILAVPHMDTAVILMIIANVKVALIFDLQILVSF